MSFKERKGSKNFVPKSPTTENKSQCKVDHRSIVNNESTYPDVFFYFSDAEDKNVLCAHHCVIRVRCPQMLEGSVFRKKKGHIVNLSKTKRAISAHVTALQRVLGYLYCGVLDTTNYSVILAVDVIHIALTYGMIHLLDINKKFLYDNLSLENVFEVLTYASGLGIEEVKRLCVNFAMSHTEFFMAKDAGKMIAFELYQEIVGVLVEHYKSGEKYNTSEPKISAEDTITENFQLLYKNRKETGDMSFIINGKMIRAHKCMLVTNSKPLDELLQQSDGPVEIDSQKFPRLTEDAFLDMLRFFYYNQEEMDLLNVCHLAEFVRSMELHKLSKCLEQNIIKLPITIQSAPFLLEVAFTQLNDNPDLKQKLKDVTITYVIDHMDEINFSLLESMPPIIGTTVLVGIQRVIQTSGSPGVDLSHARLNVRQENKNNDTSRPKKRKDKELKSETKEKDKEPREKDTKDTKEKDSKEKDTKEREKDTKETSKKKQKV